MAYTKTEAVDVNQSERAQDVLLTFQGGGAKAIVHVGALAAIEASNLNVRGVAGTSAGAMVAALVAARYTSREMLDPETGEHLIEALQGETGVNKPTDLFTPLGWWSVKAGRSLWGRVLLIAGLVALLLPSLVLAHFSLWLALLGAVLTFGMVLKKGLPWVSEGVGAVQKIRSFINYALARKLALQPDKDVTFRDLYELGCAPLKVVATNVSRRSVEVFSYERTPDVAVADAVAASICIPVLFRPWKFTVKRGVGWSAEEREEEFLDGGICSNLPVWTLDQEREQYPEARTVAFSIKSVNGETESKHWLAALLPAVIAGTFEIHTRGVANFIHIPIGCDLKLLQFDASLTDLAEAVTDAKEFVSKLLTKEVTRFPAALNSACQTMHGSLTGLLAEEQSRWNGRLEDFRLGVSLFTKRRQSWQLTPSYRFGHAVGLSEFDQSTLRDVWESNQSEAVFSPPESGAVADRVSVLIPVSLKMELADRKKEKPLILALEMDVAPLTDAKAEEEFDTFLSLLDAVVLKSLQDLGVYAAVQESSAL